MCVCVCCGMPSESKGFLSSAFLDGVRLSEGSLCVGFTWEVLAPKIDKVLCPCGPARGSETLSRGSKD